MNKDKIKEALLANPGLVAKFEKTEYFKAFAREAKLQGNISDETPSVDVTLEILSNVIMGLESYVSDQWISKFTTDKDTFTIPVGEYGTAIGEISGGVMPENQVTTGGVDVTLNKEFGGLAHWTRAYIRSATFDGMALQQMGMGKSLAKYLCDLAVGILSAIADADLAGGVSLSVTAAQITWAEFLAIVGAVDKGGYGPADYFLCPPKIYWQLLALDQFVNSLYTGSVESIKSGVLQTTLGVTVVKITGLADNRCYALNSGKAVGRVTRAEPTVEPYEKPDENEYGFVLSMVASHTAIFKAAVARGDAA